MHLLRRCGGLGLLTEVEHAGPEGGTPTFVLQATGEAEMEEITRWQKAIAAMQASDLVVLELAATYDAFREMGSDHPEAVANSSPASSASARAWRSSVHYAAFLCFSRATASGWSDPISRTAS